MVPYLPDFLFSLLPHIDICAFDEWASSSRLDKLALAEIDLHKSVHLGGWARTLIMSWTGGSAHVVSFWMRHLSSDVGGGRVCHWLRTVGWYYWFVPLPKWGCRMGSVVVWILWSPLLDGQDWVLHWICFPVLTRQQDWTQGLYSSFFEGSDRLSGYWLTQSGGPWFCTAARESQGPCSLVKCRSK